MELYDNRNIGGKGGLRMTCMCCGFRVLVAVELRSNAHRTDRPSEHSYLCLDCAGEAGNVAAECDGEPETEA